MKWFCITWHESDGNDCTVYDTIVQADTEDAALSRLGDAIEQRLTANGTPFSDDGNHIGYYFDCSEDCPEDCDGHGGTALREVTEHATEAAARADMSTWHREWSID